MYLDSNLKIEIISLLLGQEIKPFDKKSLGKTEDILSVDDFHLHNLIGKRQAKGKKPLISEEDFFDPEHDCDFTYLPDSAECTRGDELYKRPKGWYRIALKVKSKYPDGDTWLGTEGWRNHSVPGEWPVSYHGTSLKGAKGIIRSHYKAGNGDVYGRGIYSTPDIHVAEREEYAQTFTSKTTGKSYKVILQNRINPLNREICERFDYWLIRVRGGMSAKEERKIVENSIRPYGILIKELNDDEEGDEAGDSSDDGDEDDDDDEDNDGDNDGKYDDCSITDSYDDDNGHDDGNDDEDDDDNECNSDGKYDDCSDNCDDDEYEDGHGEGDDDNESEDYGNIADNYNEDSFGSNDDDDHDPECDDDSGKNDDGNVTDSCDDDEDDVENDYCADDGGDDEDDVENDYCADDGGDDEDDVENDYCDDDDGDDEDDVDCDHDYNDDNEDYDDDNADDICNDDDDGDNYDDVDGCGSEDDDDDWT